MAEKLIDILTVIWHFISYNKRLFLWNSFLAFIPLALSFHLFRGRRKRSWLWWLEFLVFFAFLPNAPYILTDVIHLIDDIRRITSVWIISLVVIPAYLLFILGGFEAYVLSLINMGNYLKRQGWRRKSILRAEWITHALCAIGIYLGRFPRFNSWDLVTKPDDLVVSAIENLTGKRPLVIMFITFVVVASLYWLMKRLTLGVLWQRQSASATRQRRNNMDEFYKNSGKSES